MSTSHRILLQANAKINLGLLVLAKRPDGYHDIETIFIESAWHDVVELLPATGISMDCTLPDLPADASNLCVKAAALLRRWTNFEGGTHIRLVKNVPVGSGLGGGSSDAAAVLVGLNRLWELNLPETDLLRLGAMLGADVPFFIHGGTAFGTGRGEILEPSNTTLPYWMVIIVPPLHISTAWAYGNVTPVPASSGRNLRPIFDGLREISIELLQTIANDFEIPVFAQYPAIRQIKQELYRAGASAALMSGSGSSVFGLFESEDAARAAVGIFPVNYRSFLTPPFFRRTNQDDAGHS